MSDSPTSGLPIVDGHCHPPLRPPRPRDPDELLGLFTESREPAAIAHAAHTLYFQCVLSDLAAFHDCAPTLDAVLAARRALEPAALVARCAERAGLVALLVDGGYRSADCYTVEELGTLLPPPCGAFPVLRLEPLLERLLTESESFPALEEALDSALADPRAGGFRALKSIVAYRSGLALGPPDRPAAAAVYAGVKQRPFASADQSALAATSGLLRLTEKPLLDYFLVRAFAAASRHRLPVQLHTGFGDADLDLLRANPLLLRPALEAGAFGDAPVVLLHGYPYLREAGYLANLYSSVYIDVSLTIPLLGPACQRALEEILELAPASKVHYGSDAAGLAESWWLGALAVRRALDGALGAWVHTGSLTASQAVRVAQQILHANAVTLYDLPAPTG